MSKEKMIHVVMKEDWMKRTRTWRTLMMRLRLLLLLLLLVLLTPRP